MRVIISSAKDWSDQESVIEALSELPASTTVLIPTRTGACGILLENSDLLKFEIEDWSAENDDYETRGSFINSEMMKTDVDMCIAFLTNDSHSTKDAIRQARLKDLDLKIITRS